MIKLLSWNHSCRGRILSLGEVRKSEEWGRTSSQHSREGDEKFFSKRSFLGWADGKHDYIRFQETTSLEPSAKIHFVLPVAISIANANSKAMLLMLFLLELPIKSVIILRDRSNWAKLILYTQCDHIIFLPWEINWKKYCFRDFCCQTKLLFLSSPAIWIGRTPVSNTPSPRPLAGLFLEAFYNCSDGSNCFLEQEAVCEIEENRP